MLLSLHQSSLTTHHVCLDLSAGVCMQSSVLLDIVCCETGLFLEHCLQFSYSMSASWLFRISRIYFWCKEDVLLLFQWVDRSLLTESDLFHQLGILGKSVLITESVSKLKCITLFAHTPSLSCWVSYLVTAEWLHALSLPHRQAHTHAHTLSLSFFHFLIDTLGH